MSPGSSTESYPAFAGIGLRKTRKNLNQVTCPDRDSNPGHLVSQPDALTVTPQSVHILFATLSAAVQKCITSSGRQHSLKCAKGKRSCPVCSVVQQEEIESIPARSYECTTVHYVFRGFLDSRLDDKSFSTE
ncbi:hypothetical protein ANN_11602 [Periplaneta americana]|uniref:Uncharacterized protein n=1 Tax=Periplaneta americana TaxID=6978 RepID=A0ABQ8T5G9_PERAM|nr:hypothetical protein ANN_11602 [Periplaneta americana]